MVCRTVEAESSLRDVVVCRIVEKGGGGSCGVEGQVCLYYFIKLSRQNQVYLYGTFQFVGVSSLFFFYSCATEHVFKHQASGVVHWLVHRSVHSITGSISHS